jgi:hypothetical protein
MDKARLTSRRFPTRDIEIVGVGAIRIRCLSREELLSANSDGVPALIMERRMLAAAMLDPEMTEDDVARWQANSPANEITAVVNAINELSGIGGAAQKEAYKSV